MVPYVPRLDIWYEANKYRGTLPAKYREFTRDEIARAEGWPVYAVIPSDYDRDRKAHYALYRALGIYTIPEAPYRIHFDEKIRVESKNDGQAIAVEYHTPVGVVKTVTEFTEPMLSAGTTESWVKEHAVKSPDDYRAVAYLYEHIQVVPAYDDFIQWRDAIGDDGLPVAFGVGACSPMHLILKALIDPTDFFYHYNDYAREIGVLASCVENFYDQVLSVCAQAPADAVLWGENIDGTLTPPPFLEKEILPWIEKAADRLHRTDKVVFCHTDGENTNLMDLIKYSGIDVAESICPYPMTRVTIDEFYRQWSDRLTIMGGIPSDCLIPEITSDEKFEDYLDYLFKSVAPGNRMIFGITDNVPPTADFDRLIRIGERVRSECRLPLEGGAFNPIRMEKEDVAVAENPGPVVSDELQPIQQAMYAGNEQDLCKSVKLAIEKGLRADEILQKGLIAAMEVIGVKFKNDEMFMPEVLLCARAMNAGLEILEPHMAGGKQLKAGKVVIGTVYGDMHDIGKNMVTIMLRGVGYEVIDMGINVTAEAFIEAVAEHQPDVLALSALLTTTMPEMPLVINALREAGLREKVVVMVGGAPVSSGFAEKIGADGYADTAGEVPGIVKALIQ